MNDRKLILPSRTEARILSMLIQHGEMYGLELAEKSDGEIPRGTVYVTLARMVKKGFVRSSAASRGTDTRGMPRKVYQATGAGEKALRARVEATAIAASGFAPQGGW